MATVELAPVSEADRSVLLRLLELQAHDLSEYVETLRVNPHGLFGYPYLDHYWTEAGRFPYFIRADGALAGFVLVRTVEDHFNLAEFFVLRSHRRLGVGGRAAALAFARHPGRWTLEHAARNVPAAAFWARVVGVAAVGESSRVDVPDGRVGYRFSSVP